MASNLPNPSDVANKWVSGMQSAGAAYTAGVQAVSTSPGQSALAQVNKYIQGVQQSVNDGTYAKGLQSFSLSDWQQAAITKGSARLSAGSLAAKSRMTTFFTSFLPQLQTIRNQTASMPTTTYEERMAKQRAFSDAVHALQGTLRTK